MVSTGLQRASCLPHFKRGKVVEAELYFHKSFCGCRDNRTLGKLVSITDFASFCIARKWSAAFILKHYFKKQLWSLVFLFSIILNTFIINSLPSWRSLLSDEFLGLCICGVTKPRTPCLHGDNSFTTAKMHHLCVWIIPGKQQQQKIISINTLNSFKQQPEAVSRGEMWRQTLSVQPRLELRQCGCRRQHQSSFPTQEDALLIPSLPHSTRGSGSAGRWTAAGRAPPWNSRALLVSCF